MGIIQLMSLKVPMGFAVCHNKFYDIDPIKSENEEDLLENWECFTQNLLQIAKMEGRKYWGEQHK